MSSQQPFVPLREEILDSPKIHKLSAEAFRFWINCLLAANRWDYVDGQLPDVERLAFWLRLTEGECQMLLEALVAAGLVDETEDGLVVHDWSEHRCKRDKTATARKRKERATKREAVTDMSRSGHGLGVGRKHNHDKEKERFQEGASRTCHGPVTVSSRAGHGVSRLEEEVRSKKQEEETPPTPSRGAGAGGEPFDPTETLPPQTIPIDPRMQRVVDRSGERWGGPGLDAASDLLATFGPDVVAYAAEQVFDKFGKQLLPGAKRYWRTVCQNNRDGPPASWGSGGPTRASPAAPEKSVEELRAQTEKANRMRAEYEARKGASP